MRHRHEFIRGAMVSLAAVLALGSAAANAAWSGWLRCEIDIRGSGYADHETHTWFVSNATARAGKGEWTVAGSGKRDQANSLQSEHVEWSVNAGGSASSSATFRVQEANGLVRIVPNHSQQGIAQGIRGYGQLTVSGVRKTPVDIAATAYEWLDFPVMQGPATGTTISGSYARTQSIGWGPQNPGLPVGSSCNWTFADGSFPPPPPAVTAPPVPVPPPAGPIPPPDPCADKKNAPIRTDSRFRDVQPTDGSRIVVCPQEEPRPDA